jgi:hypothetical protein
MSPNIDAFKHQDRFQRFFGCLVRSKTAPLKIAALEGVFSVPKICLCLVKPIRIPVGHI